MCCKVIIGGCLDYIILVSSMAKDDYKDSWLVFSKTLSSLGSQSFPGRNLHFGNSLWITGNIRAVFHHMFLSGSWPPRGGLLFQLSMLRINDLLKQIMIINLLIMQQISFSIYSVSSIVVF